MLRLSPVRAVSCERVQWAAQVQVANKRSEVVTPQVLVHRRVGTLRVGARGVGAWRVSVRLFWERAWQADPNTTGVCRGARGGRT